MKFENLSLKGLLAFFLVCVAAFMVILWMLHPPTVDAGTAALLASFVTMFIKMAADSIGYQYNSSAGSDKKDDTQAKVADKLASAVAPLPGAPTNGGAPGTPSAPVVAWWPLLTDTERNAIQSAVPNNPQLAAIMTAMQAGKGTKADLEYLVTRGMLSADRADVIGAA